ncbi:MAG TPA: hypothetical protein VGX52_18750 [Burkholderiales bacterium]|nr:hypothetical protein [Burkholderiales bacterium]
MQIRKAAVFSSRANDWTKERIGQLRKQEIEQLQINAGALGEDGIVALCEEVLRERPRARGGAAARAARAPKRRRLVSRNKAFETRGVTLRDARTSWSGVRKSDGAVVISLWADAIQSAGGGCSYLLWAPNVGGSRPWSDGAAGKERLEHCKLVLDGGRAEGVLVYGEPLEGFLPEDKARSVHGVDPEIVLHLTIERRGDEYWAVWGSKQS